MHDLIVRNARIIDGTGAPEFHGDVAVSDGIIREVGSASGKSRRVLDARGAVVAPGWIDGHTHYDGQVTWDDALEGSAANGVTTVVMGNCGVGFAPVRPGAAQALIDLMEGVEDIPGTALHEGMPWGEWETFPDYVGFLRQRRWSADVAAQLAHGALRFYVMGERATGGMNANADDLAQMSEIARQSALAGAVGFSTSRILAHRSMTGDPVPGTFAPEDELRAICRGLVSGGSRLFQSIPSGAIGESANQANGVGEEYASILDEIEMLGRISRETGTRVTFSTFQTNEDPQLYRRILSRTAVLNQAGARMYPMVAPRGIGLLTCLAGYHLFMRRPTYLKLAHLPHDELVKELHKQDVKRAILSESHTIGSRPGSMDSFLPSLIADSAEHIYPLADPLDYEPLPDQSLAAQARAAGRDVFDFFYDYLLQDGGRAVAVMYGLNYAEGNLEACREMLLDPNTVCGLSDAGAHVNFVSDMSMPTFLLAHWAKDRSRGDRLPIELLVRKLTSIPAEVFGLGDRGVIKVGCRADLNVIDLDRLAVRRPTMVGDLPAGGSRFLQPASGYVATFVNGVQTRANDEDTGERPGRLARPA